MTPLRVPLDGRVTGMPWDEIDTVVFDVGNVLLSFNPEKTLEELFPEDAEKRQIMLDTVFRSPCWVMLDRGTLSREEAVKAIKTATRRYGKRQRTWFRRDRRIRWVNADAGDAEAVAAEILSQLETLDAYHG